MAPLHGIETHAASFRVWGIVATASMAVLLAFITGCRQSATRQSAPPILKAFVRDGFQLVATNSGRGIQSYTLTNSSWTAKVDVFDHTRPRDAEALVSDGVMGLEALYANALSPYPGDISTKVGADPRFRPRRLDGVKAPVQSAFLLFANDRFGYGATTPDAARFKSVVAWLYCDRDEALLKVRLFAPVETADAALKERLRKFECP